MLHMLQVVVMDLKSNYKGCYKKRNKSVTV